MEKLTRLQWEPGLAAAPRTGLWPHPGCGSCLWQTEATTSFSGGAGTSVQSPNLTFHQLNPSARELGSSSRCTTLGTSAPEGNAAEEPAQTQPLPSWPDGLGELIHL